MSLSTLRLRPTAGARGHQHQPLSRRREGRDGGPTGTPAAHHSLRSPPPDGHEGALVSNQAYSPDVVRQPAAGRQDAAAAAVVFEASSAPSPREGADTTAAPVSIRGPSPLTALVSHEVGEQEAFLEVEPASCSSTLPAPFTTFRTIEVDPQMELKDTALPSPSSNINTVTSNTMNSTIQCEVNLSTLLPPPKSQ